VLKINVSFIFWTTFLLVDISAITSNPNLVLLKRYLQLSKEKDNTKFGSIMGTIYPPNVFNASDPCHCHLEI
jgi:hypothetical protein